MPDFSGWFAQTFSDLPLIGLFLYSFFAATLLPGGSEIALAGVVASTPDRMGVAVLAATFGNTLGGLTSYACGWFLPQKDALKTSRAWRWMERYGTPALLLSWLPLIGDLLCVIAGWLRLHWFRVTIAIAAGKLARYWIIAEGVRHVAG